MQATMLYAPGDVRFRAPRSNNHPAHGRSDPIGRDVRLRSDLWPYPGLQPIKGPTPMGHEYCGFVEEVGSAVKIPLSEESSSSVRSRVRQHLPIVNTAINFSCGPGIHDQCTSTFSARALLMELWCKLRRHAE